jgi:hypothetical protein
MSNRFASGQKAIAECDQCGFRYPLKELRPLTIKTKVTDILVCPTCWDPDHPQWQLGMYPVEDPQAIRDPRRDNSYYAVGNDGAGGSRVTQWGWNPVGGARNFDFFVTPNSLFAISNVNSVAVTSSGSSTSNYLVTDTGSIIVTDSGFSLITD